MAQIRNRFDLQNSIEEEKTTTERKLPNFFLPCDELTLISGISLSILVHLLLAISMFLLANVLGLSFANLSKPDLPKKDIEFKLVQNESKPPINKKTRIRSDRDSQAGGKHDPKKPVSQPSPAPTKQPAPAQKPQQPTKQPVKQPPKQVQKPVQKPVAQPQKIVQKPQPQPKVVQKPSTPTPAKAPGAPSVKPVIKPTGVQAPSAPKIATAPKSPFAVSVPPTKGPVGNTYKPAGTPGGSGSSGTNRGTGAPAPKFTSSGSGSGSGSQGGSNAGKYASRGSTGGYGGGNPSPGNPHGAPGIDAIKQTDWGPYMRDLEQRIKRNWTPPKNDSSKRVVITFTIGRDGRLLSRKITKSSGIASVDNAAMSAVQLTAPFRPLPPTFKGQSVPIEFTFDYNVLNSIVR